MGAISEISLARPIGIGVAKRWWQRFDGKNHVKFKKSKNYFIKSLQETLEVWKRLKNHKELNIMQHLARQQQFMAGNQNVIQKFYVEAIYEDRVWH
jgi:argonaute-like protein implicated in RNA metabolism and viral defense